MSDVSFFFYKVGELVVEGLLSMGLTRLVNEQTEGSPRSCHSGSGLKALWKLWVFFFTICCFQTTVPHVWVRVSTASRAGWTPPLTFYPIKQNTKFLNGFSFLIALLGKDQNGIFSGPSHSSIWLEFQGPGPQEFYVKRCNY